jgi:outer membrane immunogenic protein
MKKLPIVFAALALLSRGAIAADLPTTPATPVYKAPAMVAPAYSWTGIYVNAGAGYGMWQSDSEILTVAGACAACLNQSLGGKGYIGTAGGGFDFQFGGLNFGQWNPQIVAGLLGDYNFESLQGSLQNPLGPVSGTIKETAAWAGGARVGLVWSPEIFSYINGGVTGTHFSGTTLNSVVTGAAADTTPAFSKIGWFLGGGAETTLSPLLPRGFFLRSEYRYSYFGSTNVTESTLAGAPVNLIVFHPTVQALTTSLVYKFNWMEH